MLTRDAIALVVCLIRDNGPDQVIEACFRKEKVNIPMVPGMGLSLQRVCATARELPSIAHR